MPPEVKFHLDDQPTILPPESVALVLHPNGSVQVYIPKADDDAPVPVAALFLGAVASKMLESPEWVEDVTQGLIDQIEESREGNL